MKSLLNILVIVGVASLSSVPALAQAEAEEAAVPREAAIDRDFPEKEFYSKEEVLAPRFTIQDNKWVIPCIKDQEVQINVLKEKDLEVYYTIDGTEPTIESLPLIANKIKVKSDFKNYPRGQKVEIKAIAIKNGKVSTVTSKTLILPQLIKKELINLGSIVFKMMK